MAGKPKGKSQPQKGYYHRNRARNRFGWGELFEAALYSVALDVAGDALDARGTPLPLGLSGREAAGLGAMWYGRSKGNRKWWDAGLLEAAPAIKNLTGGLAGGVLGGLTGAPQLPGAQAPAQQQLPGQNVQVAGALPAGGGGAKGGTTAGAGAEVVKAATEEGGFLEDLFEGIGDFVEEDIFGG